MIPTKLRKGDLVQIITGKEKGKQGKILQIDRAEGRVFVEGANLVKKAVRKSKDNQAGGFITKEAAIAISNVMFFDATAKKTTRLGLKIEDGKKIRISKKTGQPV